MLVYNFLQRSFKLRNFLRTKMLLMATISEFDLNWVAPLGLRSCPGLIAPASGVFAWSEFTFEFRALRSACLLASVLRRALGRGLPTSSPGSASSQ